MEPTVGMAPAARSNRLPIKAIQEDGWITVKQIRNRKGKGGVGQAQRAEPGKAQPPQSPTTRDVVVQVPPQEPEKSRNRTRQNQEQPRNVIPDNSRRRRINQDKTRTSQYKPDDTRMEPNQDKPDETRMVPKTERAQNQQKRTDETRHHRLWTNSEMARSFQPKTYPCTCECTCEFPTTWNRPALEEGKVLRSDDSTIRLHNKVNQSHRRKDLRRIPSQIRPRRDANDVYK